MHATFQSNCAEGLHFSAFHCLCDINHLTVFFPLQECLLVGYSITTTTTTSVFIVVVVVLLLLLLFLLFFYLLFYYD